MKAISPGLLITLAFVACTDKEVGDTLPAPSVVSPLEVVENSDRVYYMVKSGAKTREEAEQILLALLEDEIPVSNAWFPSSGATCKCATCVACIVIELQLPEPKILDHGFLEDEGVWVCNCGVDGMWLYRFG